ncbi:MAG: T9SS type A sorting domain-containing protein, partial [Bacteroidota bacterium]
GTAAMIITSPIYGASSTLEYKGSSAQTTTGIEFLSGATAPLNLIVDNVNGVTLHSNRTLRTSAANTITLRNGVLNNGALNNISILTGSTIVRENGSFASTPNFPASVNLTYNQSLNPITSGLEVPVSTSVLNNLLMANTSGVTFNQNATVNGTWTLNSGIFTIEPGKTITIASGNQIGGTGFSIIKHIITKANQTTGDIGFIRSGSFTGSRTFPLGEGNYYMPATLNSAGTNDFNVAVFSGAALNGQPNGLQFTSTSPIVNANWIINRNTGSTPTDITFSWSESLEGGVFSAAADNQIGISRYDGTSWDPLIGTLGDNSANTVTRTGVNTFSPFIVAVLGTPLPLKFGNISAARNGQSVNVSWQALSEENVAYYDVEKSYTGRSFSKAGVVNAIANNSTSFKYSWLDAAPGNGTVFYRIKAVDYNGKYQYSSIVKVAPENGTRGLNIYPNPIQTNGRFNIEAGSLPRGTYTVELIDMSGVRSFTRLLEHTGGSLTQNMELSQSLKAGTYVMKLSGENVNYISTVVLK